MTHAAPNASTLSAGPSGVLGARAVPAGLADTAAALYELTKPRITRLVTITAGVGFTFGAVTHGWRPLDLALAALGCIVGTALSSSGASALNQWAERDRDAVMPRTAHRPLPSGRLTPAAAAVAGVVLCCVGVLVLLAFCGPAPALVSAATIIIYLLIYTPLKTVTPLNTIIGAVPGALPPLIGWTAATPATTYGSSGPLESLAEPGGWSLFILMVVWQIPHFLAIAWMYRDDYSKGGYRMLPVGDPTGRATAATILLWAVALVPATFAPALLSQGRLGVLYLCVAVVSGLAFLALCIRFARDHSRNNARAVFLGSIAHLPLVLIAIVADALLHAV